MTALRELTADEINTLAAIIAKTRPTGAPRWDPAGIRAAFAKVANLDAAEVIKATIRLAQDREARTPGGIANTANPCWSERLTDVEVYVKPDRCDVHGTQRSPLGICASCRADELAGTDTGPAGQRLPAEQVREIVGEIRDRIAKQPQ